MRSRGISITRGTSVVSCLSLMRGPRWHRSKGRGRSDAFLLLRLHHWHYWERAGDVRDFDEVLGQEQGSFSMYCPSPLPAPWTVGSPWLGLFVYLYVLRGKVPPHCEAKRPCQTTPPDTQRFQRADFVAKWHKMTNPLWWLSCCLKKKRERKKRQMCSTKWWA